MRIKKQFVIVFFILICCLFATLWSSAAETADAEEANEIIAAARKADSLYRSIIVNDTQWLCFGNLFSEKSQEKYTGMYGWIFASPQNKVYLPELTEEKSDDDYFYIQTNFTDKNELYKVIDELFYQLEGIYDEEPLKKLDDAMVLDSTTLSIDEVVNLIVDENCCGRPFLGVVLTAD